MFVDQTSLLLALGFAAFALSTTLFVTWLSARTEWFILTWSVGACLLVAAFAGFSVYAVTSNYPLLWLSNVLISGAFVIFYGAACLYTDRNLPRRRLAVIGSAVLAVLTAPFLVGFDALGALNGNLVNAVLLASTAHKFWNGRHEAPTWVAGIATLYGVCALSFIPCAVMIYLKGPFILTAPPSGWAEDINAIMGLVGLTSIGALTLALNQARVALQHRDDASTDMLTGLHNRRAVFDQFGSRPLGTNTAVLIFDLDHFKSINDRHGHAAGDETLKRFAHVLRQNAPAAAATSRIGGEEFLLVLPDTDEDHAIRVAEAVRTGFALEILQGVDGAFHGTVSSGVSMCIGADDTLDQALRRADEALYGAKRAGRNQVAPPRPGTAWVERPKTAV